jgi:putative hydrolase of the HAD superfamily
VADDGASHGPIIAEYGCLVRAILWDFDGTLGYRDGMWSGCLVEALDEAHPGHGLSAADFRAALDDGFPWHTPDVPHPELSTADAWWEPIEALFVKAYADVGYGPELAPLARRRFTTHGWQLYDDTLPALASLREHGYRHVVLSNHVPELPEIADRLGLSGHVDAIVNSAVIGYEKPHPEAFAAGRRAAGDPEELWMVGDNPIADIDGATAAGIPALLVRRNGAMSLAEAAAHISQNGRPAG